MSEISQNLLIILHHTNMVNLYLSPPEYRADLTATVLTIYASAATMANSIVFI